MILVRWIHTLFTIATRAKITGYWAPRTGPISSDLRFNNVNLAHIYKIISRFYPRFTGRIKLYISIQIFFKLQTDRRRWRRSDKYARDVLQRAWGVLKSSKWCVPHAISVACFFLYEEIQGTTLRKWFSKKKTFLSLHPHWKLKVEAHETTQRTATRPNSTRNYIKSQLNVLRRSLILFEDLIRQSTNYLISLKDAVVTPNRFYLRFISHVLTLLLPSRRTTKQRCIRR